MLEKVTMEELGSIIVLGQDSRLLNRPLCNGEIYLEKKRERISPRFHHHYTDFL